MTCQAVCIAAESMQSALTITAPRRLMPGMVVRRTCDMYSSIAASCTRITSMQCSFMFGDGTDRGVVHQDHVHAMLLHVWGWNCILTSHRMRRMTRIPVLIDTDVDIDDWMAILYLSMHPDVDLRGVTTT